MNLTEEIQQFRRIFSCYPFDRPNQALDIFSDHTGRAPHFRAP